MKKTQQLTTSTHTHENFIQNLMHDAALATHNFRDENFNLENAKQLSNEGLSALRTEEGLLSMLTAQMLSIHKLQQKSMTFANAANDFQLQQYYTNTSIKLANCFVQQTNMLAKLRGVGGQKIIVERVNVHRGGQAIVGHVQGGSCEHAKK